jgi:hypothetical protein
MYLTELVVDTDEDDALQQSDAAMSLNNFWKAGRDNCGYEGITANMVDKSTCVFKMHVPIVRQAGEEGDDNFSDVNLSKNLPPNRRSTKTHLDVTKAWLTALSIDVVRRHVAYIDEIIDPAPMELQNQYRNGQKRSSLIKHLDNVITHNNEPLR